MKKVLLSILLIPTLSFAQLPMHEGAVTYSDVVTLDSSYTSNIIYSAAKEFVLTHSKSFTRSNSEKNASVNEALWGVSKLTSQTTDLIFKSETPLKFDDPGKRITARGVFKYTGRDKMMSMIRLMYIEYSVSVYVKEGRYKLDITDFTYTHYNNKTMQQYQIGTWKDEGFCSSNGKLEFLMHCEKAQKDFDILFPTINEEMDIFHKEMVSFIEKKRTKKEDF